MDAATRGTRLRRARSAMAERAIDLLAVSPSDDLRYLVGFAPTADERPCMLLLGPERATIVVPSVNAEQFRAAVPEPDYVAWDDADGPDAALQGALAAFTRGHGAVGVDETMRAGSLLLLQETLPTARFVRASEVLGPLRLRKDERELEVLRASARTADAAVAAALAACADGRTEIEVAEAAKSAFLREGCEEPIFAIVASGPNGAFPHHHGGTRALRQGDAVVIDVGGHLDGYASDITRMAFVGQPTERYELVHRAVEAAVSAALTAAVPGARCGDVDAAARDAIEAAGFGPFFVHRTGHGLGLSAHEPPWIVAGDETPLEPGMVFSIEPGIYLPGELGVRLEEIVAVTPGGAEVLSALPRAVAVAR